jgi:ABC-type antimicrobial peptide transport system permease subunit
MNPGILLFHNFTRKQETCMARKRPWSLQRQLSFLNASFTLAVWRWRQQWLLLLMTGLGVVAAIVLIGSLPVFASVMTTAGLRNVLRAQSNSAQIIASTGTTGLSSSVVTQTTAQINAVTQQRLKQYIPATPQIEVDTGNWTMGGAALGQMQLYGAPIQTAESHLQLLQGHLPVDDGSRIEILLTQTAALYMGNIKVGTSIPLTALFTTDAPGSSDAQEYTQTITAYVAGIFQIKTGDAYWNGNTFEATEPHAGSPQPPYLGLTDSHVLLQMCDTLASEHKTDALFFGRQSPNAIYLAYTLKTASITSNNLNDLISRLGFLQNDIAQIFNGSDTSYFPPYMTEVSLSGPILHNNTSPSTLEKFRSQEVLENTPSLLLAAQIVSLILFFISVMTGALVERQHMDIAVMRSRGASRLQVLGSLSMQGIGLCLVAGLIAPVLSVGLVYLLTPFFLSASSLDALNVLTRSPWLAIGSVEQYNLIAIAVTLLTMIVSFYLAVRANIVTQRREEARSTQKPLWLRLRLDLIIAALAIAGYGLALSVESTEQLLNAQSQELVSAPLELLAPLLLLLAAILLFLRLFPYLLHLLARQMQRRRDISSMLALAQMERTPRQAIRMTLLLGLATAFAIFSLIFAASQNQRAQDIAAYQAGSDFSGYLSQVYGNTNNTTDTLAQTTAHYRQIKGVTSVSVGYINTAYFFVSNGSGADYAYETDLRAVDADTFAQTAIWTRQDSNQALSDLMAQLVATRKQALAQNEVPAIVVASTWQALGLHAGMTFHLGDSSGNPNSITYEAIAEVTHIPPADDTTQGALLVDYQTLAAVSANNALPLLPDYLWLRSTGNQTDIAHIRQVLNKPNFTLTNLLDQQELTEINAANPLSLDLIAIMSMGVATTLLLALLANVLLPLLSVRTRLTSFAVLRALGTEPAEVTRILTWEQGIILASSVLLGLLFGTLLAFTAVQPLVFTGVTASSEVSASGNLIYSLQTIIPVAIVIPTSLGIALLVLLAICLLALGIMTRLAQRPLMAQVLRINED